MTALYNFDEEDRQDGCKRYPQRLKNLDALSFLKLSNCVTAARISRPLTKQSTRIPNPVSLLTL